MAIRFRGDFRQSATSRQLQRQLGGMQFAPGRQFVSNRMGAINVLGERIAYLINGILRRAAPELKAAVIRDRMSAPHHRIGRGKYLQKNPKNLGCRRIDGDLQDSVRITVTSPGTNANGFRGDFRLSSKCGGARAPHGGIQEASGRLQFREYTTARYGPIIDEIRAGVTQIVAEFGGTVS